LSGLVARFAGRRGSFVLDAAFEAPAGAVTALFGPSGAGKTSLLRGVAGLERFEGECRLGDDIWQDATYFRPVHRRAIGYVFQEASLFPHLSVAENLRYGQRRSPVRRAIDFDAIVGLLGLAGLLERWPQHLSGGERQRVALGRALLSQPQLLLLDEPMSALDGAARAELYPYLEALGGTLALPMLLVTHDVGEVERLADRLVAVRDGKIVGSGPLNDMLVGDALGLRRERSAAAVLKGRIVGYDAADALTEVDLSGRRLLVPGQLGPPGEPVRIRVAAGDVSLAVSPPSATTIINILPAVIDAIEPITAAEALVTLRLGSETALARVTQHSVRLLGLASGQSVFAQVKGASVLTGPDRRK